VLKSDIRSFIHLTQSKILIVHTKSKSNKNKSSRFSVASLNSDYKNRDGSHGDGSSKFYWLNETKLSNMGRGGDCEGMYGT
jgi:hypothetical protein